MKPNTFLESNSFTIDVFLCFGSRKGDTFRSPRKRTYSNFPPDTDLLSVALLAYFASTKSSKEARTMVLPWYIVPNQRPRCTQEYRVPPSSGWLSVFNNILGMSGRVVIDNRTTLTTSLRNCQSFVSSSQSKFYNWIPFMIVTFLTEQHKTSSQIPPWIYDVRSIYFVLDLLWRFRYDQYQNAKGIQYHPVRPIFTNGNT